MADKLFTLLDVRKIRLGDNHTKGVFDSSVRGKTDRYVLRFKKPE